MTEASPIVFLSNADESGHKSLTTVGQVLDHSEVSVRPKLNIKCVISVYIPILKTCYTVTVLQFILLIFLLYYWIGAVTENYLYPNFKPLGKCVQQLSVTTEMQGFGPIN